MPLRINESSPSNSHSLQVLGRLVPGAGIEQAQAEIAAIAKALEIERPERNKGWKARVVSLHEETVGKLRSSLFALWGAAGLLLLIAVSNVSNLLLARGAARQSEIAVRCALGATPARLARELLTESVLLGVVGGLLGLMLALGAARLIATIGPASIPRLDEVRIDGWVVLFTVGVTVAAAVVFGVLPALKASSPDLLILLKEEGRGSTGGRGNPALAAIPGELADRTGSGPAERSGAAGGKRVPPSGRGPRVPSRTSAGVARIAAGSLQNG